MKYIFSDSESALNYLIKYNVFLTGPPGSGKSYLINNFINWSREQNLNIAITASTGIAAKIINGTTLHSWAGIGLGQDTKEKLLEKVNESKHKKRNWKKTNILIIDEISMISGELWGILDYIGQEIRGIAKPFGGIQLVAVGDFYQLPPVKGKMLIDSDVGFDKYFDYGICLNQLYRSADLKLNQILTRVRDGIKLSSKQNELLKSKVDKSNINYPVLVSLRETARDMNKEKLDEINDIQYKYSADIYCVDKNNQPINKDSNLYDNLKKIALVDCTMEKELVLKRGVPVIYLINDPLTGLVNGSVGFVEEFRNGNPVVKFEFTKLEIFKHRYAKEFNDITVVIEQYPLILSYALTIHRAQGQTLSQASILLDSSVWEDGQAYVALSRLNSFKNLSLISYNPDVFKVSAKVQEFYKQFNINK